MTSYDDSAVAQLRDAFPSRTRPWQVQMTSLGQVELSADAVDAVGKIFDLFPSLPTLTIQVDGVDCIFTRDFPSGFTKDVDKEIARIFASDPQVTGIQFPAGGGRQRHTATPDAPYWSPDGKELAEITSDLKAGKISSDEARERLKELVAKRVEAPPAGAVAP